MGHSHPEMGRHKECPVIQRRTQTEEYWQEQFEITEKDRNYLYGLILEGGKPVMISDLAQAVIERHCRQEEEVILAELSKGEVYQPRDQYEVGQSVLFPVLDYALGEVVGTRQGRNPDHGEFTVIEVQFEDEDEVREFASSLQGEHRLNRQDGQGDPLITGDLLQPQQLYELYGEVVDLEVEDALRGRQEFVHYREAWFLRDLLVPVELGHLNIAEALIEIKSMPLTTADLLPDLDLPAEVPDEIRLLSLNLALVADRRFDNVGDMGRDIWYLQRLTPQPVVSTPDRLILSPRAFDRQAISQELLLLEREVDDEGSGEDVMGPSRPLYRTTLALIYPHWRSGTLPLTVRTRSLFPKSANHHTPIVLVDGQSGDRMQGWVVHKEGFVYGLEDWYRRYDLPVGAYLKLERTRDPHVLTVDFEARRLKRLWAPVVAVKGRELIFEMRKLAIACDYDEHLTLGEDSERSVDRLWDESHSRGDTLLEIMKRISPGLVSLSPQATVHAKTIYSAVNVLLRTPPGPVFALLSTEPCFVPMGGGYWTFDPALVRV
jgi:hypothetical protein